MTHPGTPATKPSSSSTAPGTLSASTAKLNFGSVAAGSSSVQRLTLTNTGAEAVTISQATVSGSDFRLVGSMSSVSIAPGQKHSFEVRFDPTGSRTASGEVTVVSDATNSQFGISLSGAGTTAASALDVSQSALNFSDVTVGSRRALPVAFTNRGDSPITISNVTISGAGYTATGVQSGEILAPGQSATLSVTFDPSGAGVLPGSVTVSSNAANSPENIALTGTGVQTVSHSATLSWAASTSTVSGYNVYRSTVSGGPYAKLEPTPVAAMTSTDSTVQAGQVYYYVLTSVESSGVESAYSTEVSATIP